MLGYFITKVFSLKYLDSGRSYGCFSLQNYLFGINSGLKCVGINSISPFPFFGSNLFVNITVTNVTFEFFQKSSSN